jgi:hypothetical protein
MIGTAKSAVDAAGSLVLRSIDLLVDMDSELAELIATTHAAWNNLLRDGRPTNVTAIVKSAREDWHVRKERFDVARFHDAIRFIDKHAIVPDGSAKYVGGQQVLGF